MTSKELPAFAPPTADGIRRRLEEVRRRIEVVERPFDHPVEIVAVTKGFPESLVEAAVAAGCSALGENYAQDLLSKAAAFARPGVTLHFIGHLQSNKVRQIAGLVDVWETVDRASIAAEIAKRAPGATILVQVNATSEDGKGGCPVAEVAELVAHAHERGLVVDGLMTIGPTGRPPEAARPGFEVVRSLADDLGLPTCSMGMSADIEVAVAAGATRVRVGTALFGPRPRR